MPEIKITKINSNDSAVTVSCPNCENWEETGIDDPRKRFSNFDFEWMPDVEEGNEISVTTCKDCKQKFVLEWDYENPY
mgnify:CR=1 FL=1